VFDAQQFQQSFDTVKTL